MQHLQSYNTHLNTCQTSYNIMKVKALNRHAEHRCLRRSNYQISFHTNKITIEFVHVLSADLYTKHGMKKNNVLFLDTFKQ